VEDAERGGEAPICGVIVICATVAFANQGKSANAMKTSRSRSHNQKPWRETLVTSMSEVISPGFADVLLMTFDHFFDHRQISRSNSVILRELEPTLYEFEISFCAIKSKVKASSCKPMLAWRANTSPPAAIHR